MTIHWKAFEQYFAVFVIQFYPVCNFRKVITFDLGTIRSKGVNVKCNDHDCVTVMM